jgi:hypothetical protein
LNYLGRGWQSCLLGLRDYHRSILRTRLRAANGADAWLAREQLQHLLFDIEVDVAARSGVAGAARMTAVEKAVFQPTVIALRESLKRVAIDSPARTWIEPLDRALALVRPAVRRLRQWQGPVHRPLHEERARA